MHANICITNIGNLLGRDYPELEIFGGAYSYSSQTPAAANTFAQIMQNGMKAHILHVSANSSSQMFYVLKPKFWLCGVYLDGQCGMAEIVSISDYRCFSEYGLEILTEKLHLLPTEKLGIENMLAGKARALMTAVSEGKASPEGPRSKQVVILENVQQIGGLSLVEYVPNIRLSLD